jgi:hypothetical protein
VPQPCPAIPQTLPKPSIGLACIASLDVTFLKDMISRLQEGSPPRGSLS